MAEAVFDDAMKARLQAYQQAVGLKGDGEAGAKTWTKLMSAAEPAVSPVSEAAATAAQELTAKETKRAVGAPLTPQAFPLLFKIAETCQDESGVRAFLSAELGIDLDEILGNIESVLSS